MKYIINADDFGYSAEVNSGIAECFKQSVINRTTIMVNMPYAEDALRISEENGFKQSVGLHINLVEGPALSEKCRKNSVLCDENGMFKGSFHLSLKNRFLLDRNTVEAIAEETEAQIKKYIEMGFTLMHADSHQYTHTYLSVANPVNKLLETYGFKSVRISRNIPYDNISFLYVIYKKIYNRKIRNLKNKNNKIETTKYFGSLEDFEKFSENNSVDGDIEIMTHPVCRDGVLFDDTLPNPKPFFTKEYLDKKGITLENFSVPKTKMLVTFIHNHIGGAATSLLNFLKTIDTDKFEVDLIFYENESRTGIEVPKGINVLAQGKTHKKFEAKNIFLKALNPVYAFSKIKSEYILKTKKSKIKSVQIMSAQGCKYSRRISKKYDIAVAYELCWSFYYMMKYVNAAKKIVWHHNDYHEIGYEFKRDKKYFDKVDALVFVSFECLEKFTSMHSEYKNKSFFIPNLLPEKAVIEKGEEKIEKELIKNDYFNILTVARVEFDTKGLDRMIGIFNKLKNDGLLNKLRWIIIGKGRDSEAFSKMIKENGLENYIIPLGLKENPIPYMKECDILLLPSRNEGKPLVVTEAQIMGLVPVVTDYTSAKGQIKNGVDGIILENNDEAIYEGLKKIILNPQILDELRSNLKNGKYGNEDEIKLFYDMLDKI